MFFELSNSLVYSALCLVYSNVFYYEAVSPNKQSALTNISTVNSLSLPACGVSMFVNLAQGAYSTYCLQLDKAQSSLL
jgi:hypothetical protein